MRNDVNELKKLVHNIMAERGNVPAGHTSESAVHLIPETPVSMVAQPVKTETNVTGITPVSNINILPQIEHKRTNAEIQDTEEYIEENLSLDEVEKEMIKKALEKHKGRRKNAAQDLKISERTLYRKIKEYGLD